MRMTNNMFSRNLLLNLTAAQGKLDKLQNQMSTGLRIFRPSDDPVGIENALRLKGNLSMVAQYQKNAGEALNYMNTTDSVLGDLTKMIQRAQELVLSANNGTNSLNERNAIAQEISEINEQVKALANTKVGNKYLFAGTKTEQAPMSGGTWSGNTDSVQFDVGENIKISIMVDGQQLFTTPNGTYSLLSATITTPAGTSDGIFDQLLTELGGSDSISGEVLDSLDQNLQNVTALRAELGARTNRLESIQSQLASMNYNLQANLSNVEDVDMAKAITDFTNQVNVYQSALAVGARIIQPSLVDFMK
ncbi:flagellar hook-associated protein 3 [Syntrophobotulus glycolicus DSM 8271]|uniref:Flagellar hook-associated protein 3 n=1 Tax=Syntrophobotulus glycolicus (strain DSM 8271 / FlGlyR) TaxID=645991 RepID=F0SZD7_SYNGF|nr:flagellar hook-associated protein FlgL [Syntrophobotulus glycolicus]ADY54942.1 flagellar hook-associated protein 3 [Syntrophobotulus glycolicus DSM 8271]